MKLSSRKKKGETELDLSMTSMIDVVFLLLIFFMVTASFVKTERELNPAIKVNDKSSKATPQDFEPAIVEIVASGTGHVYRIGTRDFSTTDELIGVLRQFDDKSQGAFVKVSGDAPFHMAAAAIQACKDADFTAVSYVPISKSK